MRGLVSSQTMLILNIVGFALMILLWSLLTRGDDPIVSTAILPRPEDVFSIYGEMLQEQLIPNMFRSIGLNVGGYIEAIFFSVIFGFLIGLYPLFEGLFQRQVDAIRFLPLNAVTGIFLVAFGLGVTMKIHFLAFGIFIYLLPVVVQRVRAVEQVYLKTVYTLGATNWQTIKSVYIPHVFSSISSDIRVLTAISWTYIIIIEPLANEGGLGAMIWRVGLRQGRMDKTYAILLLLIGIGVFQDWAFKRLDRYFYPHKYQQEPRFTESPSALSVAWAYLGKTLWYAFLALIALILLSDYIFHWTQEPILYYLFGDTDNLMGLVLFAILAYQGYALYQTRQDAEFRKKLAT